MWAKGVLKVSSDKLNLLKKDKESGLYNRQVTTQKISNFESRHMKVAFEPDVQACSDADSVF